MGGKQETKEKVKWATNEGRGLAAGRDSIKTATLPIAVIAPPRDAFLVAIAMSPR